MEEKKLRPLHLHTLDSLCADLISARPVGTGEENAPFLLGSDAARSVLNWYFAHKGKWAGNVFTPDVEAIVDSIATVPKHIPETAASTTGTVRRYTLVSMQAHQFGGLHHAGSEKSRPNDFVFEFAPDATLLEGFNGCGKTSLLNAIIWTLTGEVLRPQRSPETGNKDFVFEMEGASQHTLPPVVPLPDPLVEKPTASALPVETWVELTFEDDKKIRYAVRRTLRRGQRGVLKDEISGLAALGLDPVGARVGTAMPGLLPFIQVGAESKLGKAVAELTGMAPLIDLASHAERAGKKVNGDLTKERNGEIDALDIAYRRSHADLLQLFEEHPGILFGKQVPTPSADPAIEAVLKEALDHFEKLKSRGLADATVVLGSTFDPENSIQRASLMSSLQPALATLKNLRALPSSARLNALSKLTEDEVNVVLERIASIFDEADVLKEIAAEPGKAARIRLYARVAAWTKEHETLSEDGDLCVVCGHDLQEAVDPITGTLVKTHLQDAAKAEADFRGQTFATWAQHVLGELSRDLPQALAQEMKVDLPEHPGALIRRTIVDELFGEDAFTGTLGLLRPGIEALCDETISTFPECEIELERQVGDGRKELETLTKVLWRVQKALTFSSWRNANHAVLASFMQSVIGQAPTPERETAVESLMGVLLRLQKMVTAIEPVNEAAKLCNRMLDDIGKRRIKEKRLTAYKLASGALRECMTMGALAEQQVEQLQKRLHKSAVAWRQKIYSNAFPTTSLDLVATKMSGDGELQLMVGASGLAAPAQHVANASALRASLVGFFLAYWQYMLRERGGLRLLLLDDPQELLDGDNRERLAESIEDLVKAEAQLIVTTHDSRFAATAARRAQAVKIALSHQYVHPATRKRGTIFLSPSLAKVQSAYDAYIADPDDPAKAQEYVSECRVFIEGRMGDIFDGADFPTAGTLNFAPTLSDHLQRLRGLVKSASNELSKSRVLGEFCNDLALKDRAPALVLLNKAHHKDKATIRPTDVCAVVNDLERLRRSAERVHEEFRLFRRRAPLFHPTNEIAPLELQAIPSFRVAIQPSLAAFVRDAAVGESQETEFEEISADWFDQKAFFYVRADNFGFAGPASSVAIVEAESSRVEDRSLVVARRGKEVFARRILRPSDSEMIVLAAETPDPRKSPKTLLVHENTVSLHRVVGMIFDRNISPPASKKEAVQIDADGLLPRVRTAYRIKEESAVPLALPDQIALGGARIAMEEFDANIDAYVALHLDDGSSIFKRIGEKLPKPLSHLRRFETIGGLGVADILAVDQPQSGFRSVTQAVLVIGVLYHLSPS